MLNSLAIVGVWNSIIYFNSIVAMFKLHPPNFTLSVSMMVSAILHFVAGACVANQLCSIV